MVFDFVDGGAGGEVTLRENRRVFDDVAFRPRVLLDVAERPQGVRVLGQDLATPVILGPTGLARMLSPEGETAAAVAAQRFGTVSVVSSGASVSLEAVATAAGAQWFQLYPWGDRSAIEALIGRARGSGNRVMVVTVDVPVVGNRERDLRNGLTVPPRIDAGAALDVLRHPRWLAGLLLGPSVTFANVAAGPRGRSTCGLAAATQALLNPGHPWDDLEGMIALWDGPVLLKGVMTGEDARRAVDLGCAGVAVSNHGGRQGIACRAPSTYSTRYWRPSGTAPTYCWTAVSGAAPTSSRPWRSAPAPAWSADPGCTGWPLAVSRAWSGRCSCCGTRSTAPWP